MRWSMRLKLPIRSLRCQVEDGADHSNAGKLLLDGEWEISTTQLDLLPAHALKLRQVLEWSTEKNLSHLYAGHMKPNWSRFLLFIMEPEIHAFSSTTCFEHRPSPKAPGRSHHLMSLFTHPVILLGSCSSTVTPLALDSFKSSD
ncbi:unnamed protein product [Musa hybrid cultivar]